MHSALDEGGLGPPRKLMKRREWLFGSRYLTCSCFRRRPLFDDDEAKQEFVESLVRTQARHGFGLIAWVIMPEHVHLLLIPRLPESPVSAVMNMLKSTHSRRVLARWREREAVVRRGDGAEPFWQPGGGYDRNVDERDGLGTVIRYIHLNPVRRGLVKEAAEWPWSSVQWYLKRPSPIELVDARLFREGELKRLIEQGRSRGEVMEMMRASRERESDEQGE